MRSSSIKMNRRVQVKLIVFLTSALSLSHDSETWDWKVWSWVQRGPESKMTVLAKTSSDLPETGTSGPPALRPYRFTPQKTSPRYPLARGLKEPHHEPRYCEEERLRVPVGNRSLISCTSICSLSLYRQSDSGSILEPLKSRVSLQRFQKICCSRRHSNRFLGYHLLQRQ
jgi:hypothetical protein